MIEALEGSMDHEAKTSQRRQALKDARPRLIERLQELVNLDTKIILIKSNPCNILAELLKAAGFKVLNTETVDYPGYWREEQYRKKLAA